MDALDNVMVQKLKKNSEASFNYLQRAMDIIKILLNRNFESYVIGDAVRNYCLSQKINLIEIITSADKDKLKEVFPALNITLDGKVYLLDGQNKFYFSFFETSEGNLSKKVIEKYYNRKLSASLQKKYFTVNALALSPTYSLTDVFNGKDDLNSMLLRTIDKPKITFRDYPVAILEGLQLVADYDFHFEKKTFKAACRNNEYLENIDKKTFICFIRDILAARHMKSAMDIIVDNRLFKYVPAFDSFCRKIYHALNSLSLEEKMTVLYLIMGNIADADMLTKDELNTYSENITICRLLIADKVTPMMVYNIGKEKLLSANNINLCYKSSYRSQAKLIINLEKNCKINNERELNFTSLELINLLNGERGIRIKAIMNIILEKVINGEIPNNNIIIKEKAKEIASQMDEIFNYQESSEPIEYTDDVVNKLLKKYQDEKKLLVKIYLNDEKELYNLSSIEREEAIKNAEEHAKTFLLETSEFKILLERGLI